MTLAYGRGTFLVLREDPVYIFRVPAGALIRPAVKRKRKRAA